MAARHHDGASPTPRPAARHAPPVSTFTPAGLTGALKDEDPSAGGAEVFKMHAPSTRRDADSPGALVPGQPATDAGQTMTSREIAELLGCRHDNVKRTIDNLSARGTIARPQSEDEPQTDALGRARTSMVYLLDKRSSYVVVAQLSPEFTGALVDRWQELEANAADPMKALSDPSKLRQMLLGYAEMVLSLEATVQAQSPKVVYADALLGAEGDVLIRDAAKSLCLPVMKTYEALRAKKVLNADGLPAARYIEKGYFRVKPVAGNNGKVYPTTRVTMLGIEWLRRFWIKNFPPRSGLGKQGNLL